MSFRADRHVHILIIGGGAIGTSLAYHLARDGAKDVLLVEKAQLTHGCTWHAAGLVGQLRGKKNLTRLMQNSVAVFDRLEKETGQAISWKKVGSLRLAGSEARWSEIRRAMGQAKSFGVECHSLSREEAKKHFPYISTDGIEGAAFIPGDGYIDPYSLTMAYAKGARMNGARIEEGVCVEEIAIVGRRVLGVVTNGGTIACDILVNCAGLWAKRVGNMAGVPLAAGIVEHHYFLTEKKLSFDAGLTTLRDPDNNFYLKPDTGSFAIGGWEDGSRGFHRGLPPFEFGRELFPANMERLELFALPAAERLPVLNEIGIQTVINGPIPVSADGEPIMGLAPGLDNFYVACGFTAGIAASGGAGLAMSNTILHGDAGMDLWPFDVRRFGPVQAQGRYLEDRAIEAYGAYYKIHWPGEETHAGRGLRRSPLHEHMKRAGAVFGSRWGWERPNWFAPAGAEGRDIPSFEEKPNWFAHVAEEHRAIRERAALIDQTSFAKLEISGKGAEAALQRIAANNLSGPPGKAVYTQLCNDKGGIEADVTLIHDGPDRFLLVTGSGFGLRDSGWVARHLPEGVAIRDVTNGFTVVNLCGPRSRDILQSVSDDDVSNDAFPFLAARRIDVGHANVLAVRIGYVGELGYELHIPQEFAPHVFEELWAAGTAHGIANAGYRAIDSCRMEKGYLYWSGDISPDYNPYEAGLGFCVALDKGEFIGRDALRAIKDKGVSRRLCSFTIEGFAPLHGGEAILSGGKVVGHTTSTGFGHTLGKTIAFGYLPSDIAAEKNFAIEAFGKAYDAARGPRCLYDAKMESEGVSMDDQGVSQARDVLRGMRMFWCLDENDIAVTRLGGLTNLVFRVDHAGEQYVLRIPGKGTEEYINRKHEAQAAREAAKAGVSPDVLDFNLETGVMVTRLIDDAVTMSPEKFKSIAGTPGRAGEAFRKLHTSGAKFDFRFELFAMIDDYLKVLATKKAKLPPGYHDIVREAKSARVALNAHPLPNVACHCDPLCENFLDTGRRMWIVDWEYSGMNDPMWDLGDLAVEGQFSAGQEEEMIRAYFGGEPSASELGRIVVYKAMCDLLWTLWGLIQHANRNPVDDFWAYSLNRLERCKVLMANPEFAVHVRAVAKGK